jgi:hypothetical protein
MTLGFGKPLFALPFDYRGPFQTRMFGAKVAPHINLGFPGADFGLRLRPEYTYASTPRI